MLGVMGFVLALMGILLILIGGIDILFGDPKGNTTFAGGLVCCLLAVLALSPKEEPPKEIYVDRCDVTTPNDVPTLGDRVRR